MGLNKAKTTLPTISPIEEILNQPPPPLMAFKLLGLDLSLITTHRLIPVGGRLSLFIHNWEILTRDRWVLATVRGYHLPLSRYPSQGKVTVKPMLDTIREKALAEEISSLVEKGAVAPIKKHQVRLTSPLFVVPKSGGGWRPIIDLRQLNQYIDSPHFKMEGLHMLPSLLQQETYMAKIDLKDAYLTVVVAKDSQPFLAFQGREGDLFQFKVLPFGLCTAPYTFTKITKPLVQFLCKVGIQILIYLDTSGTSFHSHLADGITGIRNQCAEIIPDSIETNRLLGFHNQYQHNDHITTSSEESRDTEGDITVTQMPLHKNLDTCMSVGETCGNKASSIHRSSALSRPVEFEDICSPYTTGDSCPLTRGNR